MLSNWWFSNRYLEGAKGNLFWSYIFAASAAGLAIASPFVLDDANKKFYNSQGKNTPESFQVFSAYIACLVGYDFFDKLCQFYLTKVSTKIDENIIRDWIEKINFMTITQHKLFEVGPNNIDQQLDASELSIYTHLQDFYVQGIVRALQVVGVLIASFFIAEADLTLSGIFVGYLVVSVLAGIIYRTCCSNTLRNIENEWYGIVKAKQRDITSHHLLITLYNTQPSEITSLIRLERRIHELKKSSESINNMYQFISTLFSRMALLCILAIGAIDILDPNTDFDTTNLVTVLLFYQLLQTPIQQLNNAWAQLLKADPVLRRLQEVINTQVNANQQAAVHPFRQIVAGTPLIQFANVSFTYPGEQNPVLQDVTFSIQPNTVNVIIGESKLGKSTIFRLLLQLYNQFQGNIQINGHNITRIPVNQLRNAIALIPQTTEFFYMRTLKENIKIANARATDQRITVNLTDVELGDLAPRLNENIQLGRLSGGEQKRMGAVRCLVKEEQPILYIFDEPTTGLDAKIAFEVMEKLREISAQNTVLLVTHHMKFAKSANQVLFMYKDNGRTYLQADTHSSLMARGDVCGGKYRELDGLQSDVRYDNFWRQSGRAAGVPGGAPVPGGFPGRK